VIEGAFSSAAKACRASILRVPKHSRSGKFIASDKTVEAIGRSEFFNRSTSILIAEARIALEPSRESCESKQQASNRN